MPMLPPKAHTRRRQMMKRESLYLDRVILRLGWFEGTVEVSENRPVLFRSLRWRFDSLRQDDQMLYHVTVPLSCVDHDHV